jgi:hypothetical protein
MTTRHEAVEDCGPNYAVEAAVNKVSDDEYTTIALFAWGMDAENFADYMARRTGDEYRVVDLTA